MKCRGLIVKFISSGQSGMSDFQTCLSILGTAESKTNVKNGLEAVLNDYYLLIIALQIIDY